MIDLPSRREAADPAIVIFGDYYYYSPMTMAASTYGFAGLRSGPVPNVFQHLDRF
jgi:hypothetical protein